MQKRTAFLKHITVLAPIVLLCGTVFAGFHFGMPSAVKSTISLLDQKIRSDSRYLMLKGNFGQSSPSSVRKSGTGASIDRIVLVTPYRFRIKTISADDFSISVGGPEGERGEPLGVIFIDTEDKQAGCLQLAAGTTNSLDLLPLTKIKDGVTEIDLQSISFSTDTQGNIAIPEYDPVREDREIPFTGAETESLSKGSKILANILRNPDINGNGTVDFLEDKYFIFRFYYALKVGSLPVVSGDGSYEAVISSATKIDMLSLGCLVYYSSLAGLPPLQLERCPIDYPASYTWAHQTKTSFESNGEPSSNPEDQYSNTQNNGGTDGGTATPTDGDYLIDASSYGYGNLTFNVSDQQAAVDSILIPVPTFHISGGKLTRITLVWKPRDNPESGPIDATAFIEGIIFMVRNNTGQLSFQAGGGRGDQPNLDGSDTEILLGSDGLDWATECKSFGFSYEDKFGNRVDPYFSR